MMAGASKTKGDWKEDIITNPPEEEEKEPEYKQQSKTIKELKANILDLIDDGHNSKQEIVEEVDMPPGFVAECLEDLKSEGVLEVVINA